MCYQYAVFFLNFVYQDIMDYVQGREVLYIPGAMTPTEVSVNFLVQAVNRFHYLFLQSKCGKFYGGLL